LITISRRRKSGVDNNAVAAPQALIRRLNDAQTRLIIAFVTLLTVEMVFSDRVARGAQHVLGIATMFGLLVYSIAQSRATAKRVENIRVLTAANAESARAGLETDRAKLDLDARRDLAELNKTFYATAQDATSQASKSQGQVEILQRNFDAERQLNAVRDQQNGKQDALIEALKKEISDLRAEKATDVRVIADLTAEVRALTQVNIETKEALGIANAQLTLLNQQITVWRKQASEMQAGGATAQTDADHAENVRADHAATLPLTS